MRTAGATLLIFAAIYRIGLPAEAQTQDPPAPNAPYPIDLATTLRLAGAKGVDIQIAR